MAATIEVVEVERHNDPASKTKLTATVRLGGVTVHGVRLIESQRGPFVSLPSRRREDGAGVTWQPIIELNDRLTGLVREALIQALRPDPTPPPPDDLPF